MMDLATIRAINDEATENARVNERHPLCVEVWDCETFERFVNTVRQTPMMGDYVPECYEPISLDNYLSCTYAIFGKSSNLLFVDKIGMGSPGEPALNTRELYDAVKELTKYHDQVYLGLCHEGEFQVHIAVYAKM